uniref:Phosphatidylinositol-5-phosphate 4-kinase type 2 alpha n=1 Tax=Chinchilla lanigera TaxID=34839 RepID=A0A8C2V5X2_CHILA
KEKAKELPTLKDNDFINEGQKIYIDDNNKKVFLEKLKKDVEIRPGKRCTSWPLSTSSLTTMQRRKLPTLQKLLNTGLEQRSQP